MQGNRMNFIAARSLLDFFCYLIRTIFKFFSSLDEFKWVERYENDFYGVYLDLMQGMEGLIIFESYKEFQ